MIDTTKFIEIEKGLWYCKEDGSPWSSRKHKGGFNDYLKKLKAKRQGYYVVSYKGKTPDWHRVVFEYFKGKIPEGMEVDHINNTRDDDRIENLQLLSRSENISKQLLSTKNTSGYKGVSLCSITKNKWLAQIQINKKHYSLGRFDTKEEAYNAYLQAKPKYLHTNNEALDAILGAASDS